MKASSSAEANGDVASEEYMHAKSRVEELEHEIGDWTETIGYSGDDRLALPPYICDAVVANDIQKVLSWLGPLPVDKQRIKAENPDWMDYTLVDYAVISENSDLLSILLQLGADVDPVHANGDTPLAVVSYKPKYYAQGRLLLEWGAELSNCACYCSNDKFIELVLKNGNIKLANLMKSEFGGRRCEIINLSKRPDLVGKTCVVEKSMPEKGRYKVIRNINRSWASGSREPQTS